MVLMLRANYGLIGCPGAKLWDKWGQGVLLRDTSSAYCRCTLYLMYVPGVLLRDKSGQVFCCGTPCMFGNFSGGDSAKLQKRKYILSAKLYFASMNASG